MEISIKIPKKFITKHRVKIDESSFMSDLIKFINDLENNYFLNTKLYRKIIDYGINREEFEAMIKEVEIFGSYDENHEEIGFPYEEWIDRLLQVYKN